MMVIEDGDWVIRRRLFGIMAFWVNVPSVSYIRFNLSYLNCTAVQLK